MVPQLYSTTEAAEYLGVHRRRVLQLVDEGKLIPRGRIRSGYVFEQDALDRARAQIRPYRRRAGDTDGDQQPG